MSAATSTKTCAVCKEEKSLESFESRHYKHKSEPTYMSKCRNCKRRSRTRRIGRSDSEKGRDDQLAIKFGLTIEDYERWYEGQNGCCAICGTHNDDLKRSLAVDHCHDSGDIRGLLCGRCNIGLGYFRDDPEYLRAAARYLETGEMQPVMPVLPYL